MERKTLYLEDGTVNSLQGLASARGYESWQDAARQTLTAAIAGPGGIAETSENSDSPVVKLAAPRVSLLSSAIVIDHPDDRWVAGFQIQPDGCGDGQLQKVCGICDPTTGNGEADKQACGCNTVYSFAPYAAYAGDRCSSFGWQAHDYRGRAMRRLIACESKLIEKELWAGTIDPTNPHFSNDTNHVPTTIGTGAYDVVSALSYIENFLADCSCGSQAMIHMRPNLLANLVGNSHISKIEHGDGTFHWESWMGNIIVPGRGYSGRGPAGEAATAVEEWVYVTPMVEIHRGPIRIVPDELSQAMDRRTNTITYWAERPVVAAFAPSCCFASIKVSRVV